MNDLRQFCTKEEHRYLDAIEKHPSRRVAADALNMLPRELRRKMEKLKIKAAARGWSPEHDMTKTVPDGFHVKGVSTLYNENGEPTAQWVKSQKDAEEADLQVVEDAFKERFAQVKPLSKIAAPRKKLLKDVMSAIILGDAHIGLRAWYRESGTKWDLPTARRMIVGAVQYLVNASPPCEECLIANVGDFFHTDNKFYKTTSGSHPLDTDGRWQEIVEVGIDAMVSCIDFALAKHKRVRVINMVGNHDYHTAVMMNIALSMAYKKNPRVTFDPTPAFYSYYRFGKVLIGVTHGDKRIKPAELPLIMANDCADDWGKSLYRYWYTGHLHHQRLFEPTGSNCTVETVRIMAGRDGWHQGQGYRAGREMQGIYLHREFGETGRSKITPEMLMSIT